VALVVGKFLTPLVKAFHYPLKTEAGLGLPNWRILFVLASEGKAWVWFPAGVSVDFGTLALTPCAGSSAAFI